MILNLLLQGMGWYSNFFFKWDTASCRVIQVTHLIVNANNLHYANAVYAAYKNSDKENRENFQVDYFTTFFSSFNIS